VESAPLSGVDKAAVLVLSLPEEDAKALLEHMQEDEIEQVLGAVARIEDVSVEVQAEVLAEFKSRVARPGRPPASGRDRALALIDTLLPKERGERVRLFQQREAEPIAWALLPHAPTFIATTIEAEDPQTVALIVSQLSAPRGAALVSALPDAQRAEVVRRLAALAPVSASVIRDVADGLDDLFAARLRAATDSRGVEAAAQVVAQLRKPESDALLEALSARDAAIAEEIRRQMFTFDHLSALEDRDFKKLLQNVPIEDLVLALKTASPEVRGKVLGNLSNRARQSLIEEEEMMGPRRVSEIEAKQREIVEVARGLADQGEITINGSGDESFA
jgi:flagellar motor switch protein FliG